MSIMVEDAELEQLMNEKFISKDKFSEEIEQYVLQTKLSYIDAILEYCELKGIEMEVVGKLISKPLKEKIKFEAIELNYLTATTRARLPF
jgi:hypothetical protein